MISNVSSAVKAEGMSNTNSQNGQPSIYTSTVMPSGKPLTYAPKPGQIPVKQGRPQTASVETTASLSLTSEPSRQTDQYLVQKVMTAPKEELPLLLYHGAIRFINQNMGALEKGNLSEAHEYNMKAQAIIQELTVTLEPDYEISRQLNSLYDFVEYSLIQANVKKDKTQLNNAKEILESLRDTWVEAVKLSKTTLEAVNNGPK